MTDLPPDLQRDLDRQDAKHEIMMLEAYCRDKGWSPYHSLQVAMGFVGYMIAVQINPPHRPMCIQKLIDICQSLAKNNPHNRTRSGMIH